jgi:hypothetical protein
VTSCWEDYTLIRLRLLWPVNPKTDAKNGSVLESGQTMRSRAGLSQIKPRCLVEEESTDEVIDKSTDFRCWPGAELAVDHHKDRFWRQSGPPKRLCLTSADNPKAAYRLEVVCPGSRIVLHRWQGSGRRFDFALGQLGLPGLRQSGGFDRQVVYKNPAAKTVVNFDLKRV